MRFRQANLYQVSPVALVTLSACGGDTTLPVVNSKTVSGNVVNGPLSNALVFLDLNSNGILDGNETFVRTGSNGEFSISTNSSNYEIVAQTDSTTVDTSSGQVLAGVTLKAPSNASMISPTTTLMKEGNLTPQEVAAVLGLPDGVDPLSFNPYADGVDATSALAVAKISKQITTAIKSFASAAEGAGASEKDAFEVALKSVVEVVKTKAGNINNSSATAAEKKLDFTKSEDLNLIKVKTATEVSSKSGVNFTAFGNLIEDTTTSIKNVNGIISGITDLSSDATKDIFATTTTLSNQIKSAVAAEVQSNGSGSISLSDANIALTVSKNKTPSDLTLTANKIREDAHSLSVGTLKTVDRDQPQGTNFKYEILEGFGSSDYDKFSINQETGELSLKNKPNYSNQKEYQVAIQVTDAGGKSITRFFKIEVVNPDEKKDVSKSVSSEVNAQNISDSGNDKTLIVVIDNFSERVHEYTNTTLYDYGYLDLVTYYDNLYDVYSGEFTDYGTYDASWIDIPDISGGFYQVTPDKDSTSDLDLDLTSSTTFTDILGNKAYADTYLAFKKVNQKSEVEVAHGDWVVEAICQTLEDPSKTEILCIDVDTLSNTGDFGKLFHQTSYTLDGLTYTGTNIKKIVEDFAYQNDSRLTGKQSDYVYSLSGITMSISGNPKAPVFASSFISELETFKVPFFQSAPNVNNGIFDWSTFVPNVISVGAWNVDGSNNLLVANETAIPTIDLYANGYIQKEGWGENFGTSFATPTVAASFADYLNGFIKQLHASGQTVEDIQISNDQLAAIDYTKFVDSIVSSISKPVDISLDYLGSPLTNVTIKVLDETLQNDGIQPVKADKWSGIDGLTLSSVKVSNTSGSSGNNNSYTNTNGKISDFSIIEQKYLSEGIEKTGHTLKVRFKIEDINGGLKSLNLYFEHLNDIHTNIGSFYFDKDSFVYKEGGYVEAVSKPLVVPVSELLTSHNKFKLAVIDMEDNAANRFKYWEDSSLISNLTTKNKQITVEHKRETEPNDSQNTPNKLAILDNPFVYEVISGNISDPSDYDYYGFSLQNKTKIKIDLFVNRTQNLFDHDHYLSINHKTEGRIEEKIIDKYGRIEKELDAGDYLVGIGSADDADYNLVVDIV